MNQNRILVVEDGPGSSLLSLAHLNHAASHVEILAGGESVLERIQRAPFPDAIVVNIEEIEKGITCIARVRRVRPLMRVIALLPPGDEDLELAAFEMRADICARKLCDDRTLNGLIEQCLGGA